MSTIGAQRMATMHLAAGQELDELIERRIFGGCPHLWAWSDLTDPARESGYMSDKICTRCGLVVAGLKYVIGEVDVAPYSTEAALIPKLLQAAHDRGLLVELWSYSPDRRTCTVSEPMDHRPIRKRSMWADGETLSLALCRALLLALEPA